jgi:2-keto-4-pentenoate hydratase/2-oxohepta-3-ene-1,7-dioic acid hydratase in catechol pathway
VRLATYQDERRQRVGIVVDSATVIPLRRPGWLSREPTMLDVVEAASEASLPSGAPRRAGRPLSEVNLLAPIPNPRRNIFCIGKNYEPHAREFERSGYDTDRPRPNLDAPIVFTKTPESVVGHGTAIQLPDHLTDCLDYEAELAVVIGKPGRAIPRGRAQEHIFGYTILNDVTARDLQLRHGQWFLGKALDASSPIGPWIVTADELDPTDVRIRCWVNGELRQDARTAEMLFDIPALIEVISAGMTLLPGDIIATGTPAGVGAGHEPPRFLAPGDEIRIDVTGIGQLINTIVSRTI